ncbi:MAG: amidohydrolase [Acidobacteria bacterium]|nr:amidohydrolase [Acidobacteriota bacterium]
MRRRDFLKQGAILPAASAVLGAGQATAPEKKERTSAPLNGNFIDAHVHVWTDDFQKYPLPPGHKPGEMHPPRFLPEDILRPARPSGVNRIVLIQMSYYRFDNSYMLDVIRLRPQVFRGIAIVDWRGKDPDAKMRELARHGVRGFRIYPNGAPPASWLDGEGFEKMFRCGAEEHLAICPLINPDALPAVGRQCEKFPETPVIIDHLARIGADGSITRSDINALCALSRHPQVKVKVSAFYALGAKKPPHLDLVPLIRRVYAAFGAHRLMWASDCPFQLVSETYEDSISLVRDRLDFLSPGDKEWMLRRTAEEFFFR